MPKWMAYAACLLLAAAAAGCDAVSTPDADPSIQSSAYSVDRVFKDPKAQALAIAAEHGDGQEVARLMKQEHVDPNRIFADDDSRMPLLAWPIFTHNLAGLKAMLDNGADPNARDPDKRTERYADGSGGTFWNHDNAMVWAAKQDSPAYLSLLLAHGGDPNTRNSNDETLLFQAYIWHNQWPNVQTLIEHGADINALSQGRNIFYEYAKLGGFERAYWLLQHGADPLQGKPMPTSWPPKPYQYPAVESVFWYPENPKYAQWQQACQKWLLDRGWQRPPMPETYKALRENVIDPAEKQ